MRHLILLKFPILTKHACSHVVCSLYTMLVRLKAQS